MAAETRQSPSFEDKFTQWHAQEDSAIKEAERLRESLDKRRLAREQNVAGIQAKLDAGYEVIKPGHKVKESGKVDIISVEPDGSEKVALSDRQISILQRELYLLTTYKERHLRGESAVNRHIWIRFGLNYPSVMSHRTAESR